MFAREGVVVQLHLNLYLWREGLRIVGSEEISEKLSNDEVVCLEAELEGG